jgi:CheY-like chemotaxis protein
LGAAVARILVVDDENSILKVMQRALGVLGHDVTAVASGTQAIDACVSDVYHVVLLDLTMRPMSGDETLRRLRAQHPALQIVLMSGQQEEQLTDTQRELANGFLPKPFQIGELKSALAAVL